MLGVHIYIYILEMKTLTLGLFESVVMIVFLKCFSLENTLK